MTLTETHFLWNGSASPPKYTGSVAMGICISRDLRSIVNTYRRDIVRGGGCSGLISIVVSGIVGNIVIGVVYSKCRDVVSGINIGVVSSIASSVVNGVFSSVDSGVFSSVDSGISV